MVKIWDIIFWQFYYFKYENIFCSSKISCWVIFFCFFLKMLEIIGYLFKKRYIYVIKRLINLFKCFIDIELWFDIVIYFIYVIWNLSALVHKKVTKFHQLTQKKISFVKIAFCEKVVFWGVTKYNLSELIFLSHFPNGYKLPIWYLIATIARPYLKYLSHHINQYLIYTY